MDILELVFVKVRVVHHTMCIQHEKYSLGLIVLLHTQLLFQRLIVVVLERMQINSQNIDVWNDNSVLTKQKISRERLHVRTVAKQFLEHLIL